MVLVLFPSKQTVKSELQKTPDHFMAVLTPTVKCYKDKNLSCYFNVKT